MADSLRGVDKVLKNLSKLDSKAQKRVLSKSIRRGANIVRDDARQRAKEFDNPDTKNKVWKGIKTRGMSRRTTRRYGAEVGARVQVRSSQKNPVAWYAHFEEFGSENNAANPFMRPALKTKKDDVLREVRDAIADYIESEME